MGAWRNRLDAGALKALESNLVRVRVPLSLLMIGPLIFIHCFIAVIFGLIMGSVMDMSTRNRALSESEEWFALIGIAFFWELSLLYIVPKLLGRMIHNGWRVLKDL